MDRELIIVKVGASIRQSREMTSNYPIGGLNK
jgi:hypothetical protein